MKILIIGGTGLIGTRLGKILRDRGHEAVPASPSSGVNSLTGEGLAEAMKGADVVVDVANSPSFEDAAVLKFFDTATRNLLGAAAESGVKHFVALSVVGADRLPDSGYFRAKVAQETLIRSGKIPYTILRATQFLEFLGAIADSGMQDGTVRLPSGHLQPIAADDVAAALADVALAKPVNGMVEVGGPERLPMAEFVRRYLVAIKDARTVVADANARYFNAVINDQSLTTGAGARIGAMRFDTWVKQAKSKPA